MNLLLINQCTPLDSPVYVFCMLLLLIISLSEHNQWLENSKDQSFLTTQSWNSKGMLFEENTIVRSTNDFFFLYESMNTNFSSTDYSRDYHKYQNTSPARRVIAFRFLINRTLLKIYLNHITDTHANKLRITILQSNKPTLRASIQRHTNELLDIIIDVQLICLNHSSRPYQINILIFTTFRIRVRNLICSTHSSSLDS